MLWEPVCLHLIHTFHGVLIEAGALSGTRGPLLPVGTPSYCNSSHTRLGGYHGSCETGGILTQAYCTRLFLAVERSPEPHCAVSSFYSGTLGGRASLGSGRLLCCLLPSALYQSHQLSVCFMLQSESSTWSTHLLGEQDFSP